MSCLACISITTAVIITIVDVAIERPIGDGVVSVAKTTGFTTAFLPILNMSIAFCKPTPSDHTYLRHSMYSTLTLA